MWRLCLDRVLAALLLAGSRTLLTTGLSAAQLPEWTAPAPHHHAANPPDYLAELLAEPEADIDLPPPPIEWIPLAHHEETIPNYFEHLTPSPLAREPFVPPPPPGEPPAVVRGIYLNAWVFGLRRFEELLRLADTTEINAFVIDVKDDTGYLTYTSSVPLAIEIGANAMPRAPDAARRLALLRERGIHPIARIVVAKDPLLALRKPEWAIRDIEGGLWRDRLGTHWVDAYNDSIWIYAAQLATEAVLMGFGEIQFDYLRFPDEPPELLARAVFPYQREGESRRAALRRHVALMRELTRPLGVPFTLDVFGLTTSARGDLGIGQVWEDLAPIADVILPMVYPSHYRRGEFGIAHPNAQPYLTVRRALEDALQRNRTLERAPRVRPYLQAFSIFGVRYGLEQIRAQIRAAAELGVSEWILWNPRAVYPAEAFLPRRATVVEEQTSAGTTWQLPPPAPRQ